MPWLNGLIRNWAEWDPDAADPRLRPVVVPGTPAAAVPWAAAAVAALPRWWIVAADPRAGTLHAVHATWFWRFRDDVHLRFEPDPAGTRVLGRSTSRIGVADFGQNARNLRELSSALACARLAAQETAHVVS
jgi:uncharacterized protein (DUF1499 family)